MLLLHAYINTFYSYGKKIKKPLLMVITIKIDLFIYFFPIAVYIYAQMKWDVLTSMFGNAMCYKHQRKPQILVI